MIELSMEEWEKRMLDTKQYKTVGIEPSKGVTTVFDQHNFKFYRAKYNMKTNMMNLHEVL